MKKINIQIINKTAELAPHEKKSIFKLPDLYIHDPQKMNLFDFVD